MRELPATRTLRSHQADDLDWIVEHHGVLYATEFGWDQRFQELVARIVDEFRIQHDPVVERCWIAELQGQRVGCVMLVKKAEAIAQLRLLLVDPKARGTGLGYQLMDTCIQFARAQGYRRLTLWTSDVLHAAKRLYERTGFRFIEEEPHTMFGPPMLGQTWVLEL